MDDKDQRIHRIPEILNQVHQNLAQPGVGNHFRHNGIHHIGIFPPEIFHHIIDALVVQHLIQVPEYHFLQLPKHVEQPLRICPFPDLPVYGDSVDTDFKLGRFQAGLIPQPDERYDHAPLHGYLPAQFHYMDIILFYFFHKKRRQFHVKLQDNCLRQQKPVDFLLPKYIFLVWQVALSGFMLQQVVQGAIQYFRNTA